MLRIVHSSQPSVRLLTEDLEDPAVAARTTAAVEGVFKTMGLPGAWTVALAASETRGRWNVAVRGSRGAHFFSFAAAVSHVPQMMTEYLSRCVQRILSSPLRSSGPTGIISTR